MVKKWTIWILLKLWAFVLFTVSIVEDISTFLREDGKGSAFSSRRGFAVTFVVAAVYSISLAIRTFADLLRYGWIAALVFIPVVICGVFAAIFSYYASSKDFDNTISAIGKVQWVEHKEPSGRAGIPGEGIVQEL